MKLRNPGDNYNVLDLDQLVKNVMRIMQNVDSRVIKPESYLYSELMKKHPVKPELGLDADLAKFIQRYNGEIQYDENCDEDVDLVDVRFKPITPRNDTLIHQNWFWTGDVLDKNISQIMSNKVIGSNEEDCPTYLKETYLPCGDDDDLGSCEYGVSMDLQVMHSLSLLFEIDVKELQKTRNIFYDPEGLSGAGFGKNIEYLSTYIIFGGIPCQAIKSIKCPIIQSWQPYGGTLMEYLESPGSVQLREVKN
ncbi:hypothetical protein HOC13_00175 [Candidatus Woesearchaeota archaeon]|nr:hypothetical protein [Candidatus Woesearchaeota archaeon]